MSKLLHYSENSCLFT